MEFAVLDLETTGLFPKTDRVTEVGVVRLLDDGTVIDEFDTLINPERDIGPTSIHGITAGEAMQAPTFAEVADDLLAFLNGAVIVAHNAAFDKRMLTAEFRRLGVEVVFEPLCTLQLACSVHPNSPRALGDCCDALGVQRRAGHQALNDAYMSAGVLVAVLAKFRYPAMPPPFIAEQSHPSAKAHRLRRAQAGHVRQTEGQYLASLITRLPPMPNVACVNTAAIAEYCNLVDRVLEDRRLDEDEAELLAEFAVDSGLSRHDIEIVHAAYYADLLRVALADNIITDAEKADLSAVAHMLQVDESAIREPTNSLEAPSTSKSLLAGTTVCFTGEMERARDECTAIAESAGMVVLKGVTKKLDLLVVADPDTQSGKADKARRYGTRVVAEPTFWMMIDSA